MKCFGQRNCPKHVESYSKNKLEILVHLVGFIIRIHHDTGSPEFQKLLYFIYKIDNIFRSTKPTSGHQYKNCEIRCNAVQIKLVIWDPI